MPTSLNLTNLFTCKILVATPIVPDPPGTNLTFAVCVCPVNAQIFYSCLTAKCLCIPQASYEDCHQGDISPHDPSCDTACFTVNGQDDSQGGTALDVQGKTDSQTENGASSQEEEEAKRNVHANSFVWEGNLALQNGRIFNTEFGNVKISFVEQPYSFPAGIKQEPKEEVGINLISTREMRCYLPALIKVLDHLTKCYYIKC